MVNVSNAIGGMKVPPTRRAKFDGGNIWIDLIHHSPASPLFRARQAQHVGTQSLQDILGGTLDERDEDGKIRVDLTNLMFNMCVAKWGMWGPPDKDGRQKAVDLVDADGEVVECNAENFASIIRDNEGGEELFYMIVEIYKRSAWFKLAQSADEKNYLRPSRASSTAATSQRTQRGPKAAPSSKRSKTSRSKRSDPA